MLINKKVFYLSLIVTTIYSPVSYAIEESNFSMGKVIFKFILYILIIFGVIILTIYGTKFIAKSSKRFVNSRYIKILDKINLDPNTKVLVLEIDNLIYILAITNNYIETIDKIPREDFEFKDDVSFEKQLEWHRNKYANKDSSNRFKIEQFSDKWDKFFNKEDENNEE